MANSCHPISFGLTNCKGGASTRILAIAQSTYGHLLPILGLCQKLIGRGYKAALACDRAIHHKVRDFGVPLLPFQRGAYPDRYLAEMSRESLALIESVSPDIVINDSSLPGPAFAAELRNIPTVSYQVSIPVPDHLQPGGRKLTSRLREAYGVRLQEARRELGLPAEFHEMRTRGDLAGISSELHLVLVYAELISFPEVLPAWTKYVGSYWPETEPTRIDMRQEKPSVLVCLSSVSRDSSQQVMNRICHTAAEGLKDEPYQVLITGMAREGRIKLPDNFAFTDEFPAHTKLMPMANMVITHAGCGTVQTAIRFGVPLLAIPLGIDQKVLAEKLESLKIGEVLPPDLLMPDTIRSRVRRIMNRPLYLSNVREMARTVNKDVRMTGEEWIDRFIRQKYGGTCHVIERKNG